MSLGEAEKLELRLRQWLDDDDAVSAVQEMLALGWSPPAVEERPPDWPEKCAACGADWTHLGFDHADGFNCRACGSSDSDEGSPSRDGLGFQAGAHTEQVNPCPLCQGTGRKKANAK